MTDIALACLDMAGTTVRDDGAVIAAFLAALRAAPVPEGTELDAAMEYARTTMGQSKIEVFRSLLGDERRAQAANRAFEAADRKSVV